MTENEFEAAVVKLAHRHGWKVFGTARATGNWRTPIRHDGKGFPDVVAVHRERCCAVVAEFKVGANTLSDDQIDWIETWKAVQPPAGVRYTVRVFVWYPDDAAEIADVLSFGSEPGWTP